MAICRVFGALAVISPPTSKEEFDRNPQKYAAKPAIEKPPGGSAGLSPAPEIEPAKR
jgi:hypothetical protein